MVSIEGKNSKRTFFNKKAIIISIVCAIAFVALVFHASFITLELRHIGKKDARCEYGMNNYRFGSIKKDMTRQEIIDIYGEFDSEYPSASSDIVAYRVGGIEAGFVPNSHKAYFVMAFTDDSNTGKLEYCWQEVVLK